MVSSGPLGESMSGPAASAMATAELTGAAHAQAPTWSSKVKAIPRYNESPTGRSTLALQGTNGLLLEEFAAAHLRSKLTHGNPDEFHALINDEMVEEKEGSGKHGSATPSLRRASMSVRMRDHGGGDGDHDGGDSDSSYKPPPSMKHVAKSNLFTKSGKLDLNKMGVEEADGEWDI
jgi:hypothetical protein